MVDLKTHTKIILVVRQDYKGLRRYVHLGTGNYHPETSRIYSDLDLLIYDKAIGQDATELFNYLTTGYTPKRHYQKLLVAPKMLKNSLIEKIRREIAHARDGKGGHIFFKMNALDDVDISRALYEASIAGVKIDLIIRDSCRVRPGVAGLSDNIRVVSIVGRFLEHSRVFYFANNGAQECYIGSADAMKRNLEHRVEVLGPVESPDLQNEILEMLTIQLNNRRSAWDMRPDGSYLQRWPQEGEECRSSQEVLVALAEKRNKDITRLKKRKTKNCIGRNLR